MNELKVKEFDNEHQLANVVNLYDILRENIASHRGRSFLPPATRNMD